MGDGGEVEADHHQSVAVFFFGRHLSQRSRYPITQPRKLFGSDKEHHALNGIMSRFKLKIDVGGLVHKNIFGRCWHGSASFTMLGC
jgi:hypothetical protein